MILFIQIVIGIVLGLALGVLAIWLGKITNKGETNGKDS